MPDDQSSREGATAIDFDTLDRIGQRLAGSRRFEAVEFRPAYAPDSLVVEFDLGYFPALVERAYLRIRWFENGDFNVHYSEQYGDGDHWECRWDRHPNDHNAREHFHPPPNAENPGRDATHPSDWRDVLTKVLGEIDRRVEAFWE